MIGVLAHRACARILWVIAIPSNTGMSLSIKRYRTTPPEFGRYEPVTGCHVVTAFGETGIQELLAVSSSPTGTGFVSAARASAHRNRAPDGRAGSRRRAGFTSRTA
jgi:hypothetical protein